MRLALKIFLAYSLVILVVAGIAVWSLQEVGKLSIAGRAPSSSTADALSGAVSLREAVTQGVRLERRSLVFGDAQFAAAAAANAGQIKQGFDRLSGLLASPQEKTLLAAANRAFDDYQAAMLQAHDLIEKGDRSAAERAEHDAQPLVGTAMTDLHRLVTMTRDDLEKSQLDAANALIKARSEVEGLRQHTWQAVSTAMALAIVLALGGTAAIALYMTRSLRRLSDATKAVAEGAFNEPIPVGSSDEIGELAQAFNSMAARLREIDEMKEKFYATVSHELRSPLTAMNEAVRLIEGKFAGPLTPKQERLVAILLRGMDRLLKMVNEVLDLSRMSAGMLAVERRWFDLGATLRRTVDELSAQADQRGIALTLNVAPAAGRMLGDEERIVQIVVNLVANALRFTPAGGRVTVRADNTGGTIRLVVEDTGIGIPASQLPLVFERFRQAHSGKGGTGLGLAIVKSLVEAHDGSVEAESEEGKGSRFMAIFPAAGEMPAAEAREARQA